jgi:lycopene epsilon-cyclase
MYLQAGKRDEEQGRIADQLSPLNPKDTQDVLVVGCGPAGLYLAAQVAQRGLKVGLIGEGRLERQQGMVLAAAGAVTA